MIALALTTSLLAQQPAPPPVPPPPVMQAPVPAPPAPAAPPSPAPAMEPYRAPAAPQPATAALPMLRVALAPCDAGGPVAGPSLSDIVADALVASRRVMMMPPPPAPLAGRDATSLALHGAAARAEKTVCVQLHESGASAVVAVQLVDVSTASMDWQRVAPVEGQGPDAARQQASSMGQELSAFILEGFQGVTPAPHADGPPVPEAPMEAPALAPAKRARRVPGRMAGMGLGAGIALLAAGAAMLPAAAASLFFAGAAHLGGRQLVFTAPDQAPPRYFSAVFTWTWGDVATATVLVIAGLAMMTAGAILAVAGLVLR